MAFSIGLTGSIASGKSTVAQMFADLGIDILCSDTIARALTAKGQPALAIIVQHFGKDILQKDQNLDRKKLRELIFSHPEERIWLENLLHPIIRQTLQNEAEKSKSPYCIVDIPLLYNRRDYPWLQRILVVTTSDKHAISRIMQRDQCTEEQAQQILAIQQSQVNYADLADDLLMNDGSFEDLRTKVNELHAFYSRESL